jgi:hypothetical protein
MQNKQLHIQFDQQLTDTAYLSILMHTLHMNIHIRKLNLVVMKQDVYHLDKQIGHMSDR